MHQTHFCKKGVSINLITLLLLVHVVYIGIRCYV
ncbi:DUF6040 family protein, partial [Agathobacter rectalis]